jgi:hypothetical protein
VECSLQDEVEFTVLRTAAHNGHAQVSRFETPDLLKGANEARKPFSIGFSTAPQPAQERV